MLYSEGDKFLYREKECIVVYVNAGRAWLATSEDPHVTITNIDMHGNDSNGNKAICINNTECLAV